jgi:hypothetical protein
MTAVLLRSNLVNIAFCAIKKRRREFTIIPTIEVVVPNNIEGFSLEIRFINYSFGIFFIR